jgi:hypothetical protein
MQCTGRSNYLIQDWNGTFLSFKGTILPDNRVMGDNEENCTWNESMNAHVCKRTDFVVLEYESKASDYNSRVVWPVTLTPNNSNYTTVINAWKEWDYANGQPLGHRLARFVSVVKLNTEYNMSFASMPPLDMNLQLQRRTPQGNNSNWMILKLYYPLPNSIRVFVNNTRLSPIITTDITANQLRRELNTSKCGDNIYHLQNRTIKIVLT